MTVRSKSNTSLFILEMIIVCGFLLYCSSIFVKAFVKTEEISRYTKLQNEAILFSQQLAEDWKAGKIDVGVMETCYYQLVDGEVKIVDSNFNGMVCKVSSTELEESMYLEELNLQVCYDTQSLYSLIVTRFREPNQRIGVYEE